MSKQKPIFRNGLFFGLALLLSVVVLVVQMPQPSYAETTHSPKRGPVNPDFLNYLNARTKTVLAHITKDGHYLGYIPSPHLASSIRPVRPVAYSALLGSYDLRAQNKLTPIKDQGACGSCWAFATYGALESYLMPTEENDYSENDLIQNHGFSLGPCVGGLIDMAVAYLGRWQGPINEADNTYPYSYSQSLETAATVQKHVQNAIYFPIRVSTSNDDILKTAVMNYGAIFVTMHWCSDAYNGTSHSYYDDGSYAIEGGHAVCIVGWDDNYPASQFNTTAPGKGAFIVRNSWGTSWGESGYFYVSYYDHSFGQTGYSASIIPEPTSNHMSIYQYDPLGWVESWGYIDTTAWAANIFTATDNEPVTSVSFYAVAPSTSYEIYVYTGVTAGKPRTGTLRSTASGTLDYAGYYTIDLSNSVPLTANEKFSVVIKFTTPSSNYPIPAEDFWSGYSDSVTSSPGQSFMDHSGTTGTAWYDCSADTTYKTNICIKAFTGPNTPSADIAVSKSVDNLTPLQGSELNFTITAKNNGPDDATGLKVTDLLPAGLSYVSSTPSQGTYDSGTGIWDIGPLAKDATVNLTIKVSADNLGQIINTASESALKESDPVNSNDSASVTVNVTSQYSLTTAASPAAGGTVTPAGTTSYDKDQAVQVQATSNFGYVFTGWSGDLSGTTNPVTITMSGPKNVTAIFAAGKTLNPPVLTQPANNATGQPATVTFQWLDTNSSPQELKYKVRIKKAGGAYANYTLPANTVQYIKAGLTPGKIYYWNVMALGTGTTTKNSAWANGGVDFKFTVQPPITLNMPTLVSPANGAIGQPTTITLQWLDTNNSPQELNFKIRLKPAGGAYKNYTVSANTVSFLKTGLLKNKTYYWSVQAVGNGTSIKNSVWPADWKFTTQK